MESGPDDKDSKGKKALPRSADDKSEEEITEEKGEIKSKRKGKRKGKGKEKEKQETSEYEEEDSYYSSSSSSHYDFRRHSRFTSLSTPLFTIDPPSSSESSASADLLGKLRTFLDGFQDKKQLLDNTYGIQNYVSESGNSQKIEIANRDGNMQEIHVEAQRDGSLAYKTSADLESLDDYFFEHLCKVAVNTVPKGYKFNLTNTPEEIREQVAVAFRKAIIEKYGDNDSLANSMIPNPAPSSRAKK